MSDPITESINKFIKEKEEDQEIVYLQTPVKFTRLKRAINALPKDTTGWFHVNEHPVKRGRHLFQPYDPQTPNKWIDKYGTQQIDYIKKEDVE